MSKESPPQEVIQADKVPDLKVKISLRYFYLIIIAILIAATFILSKYFTLQNEISKLGYKYESLQKDLNLVKEFEIPLKQEDSKNHNSPGVIVNYSAVELSNCKDIIQAIQMLTAVRITRNCNPNNHED